MATKNNRKPLILAILGLLVVALVAGYVLSEKKNKSDISIEVSDDKVKIETD